jgi:hypothetical protein
VAMLIASFQISLARELTIAHVCQPCLHVATTDAGTIFATWLTSTVAKVFPQRAVPCIRACDVHSPQSPPRQRGILPWAHRPSSVDIHRITARREVGTLGREQREGHAVCLDPGPAQAAVRHRWRQHR